MARANPETEIQSDMLKALNKIPGIEAYRLSNHAVAGIRNGEMFFRKDKWKLLGIADIIFFHKGGLGFIEVKCPGKELSDEQIEFKKKCEARDIPCFRFDNVQEAFSKILELFS